MPPRADPSPPLSSDWTSRESAVRLAPPKLRERLALVAAGILPLLALSQGLWGASGHAPAVFYVTLALSLLGLLGLLVMWRRERQQRVELVELRVREDRLSLCLWASGNTFWDWDLRQDVLYRAGSDRLFGTSVHGTISGSAWRGLALHPEDVALVDFRVRRHLNGEVPEFKSEHRMKTVDGSYLWMRSRGRVVERDLHGKPTRMAGTAVDITATREAERELLIAQEALHSISEGVAVLDLGGMVRTLNPAFERMTGYPGAELYNHTWEVLASQRVETGLLKRLLAHTCKLGGWSGELWMRRKSAEDFYVAAEFSLIPERSGEQAYVVVVLNDLTERKRAEGEVKQLTNFDPLTGLPNRASLMSKLTRTLQLGELKARSVGLIFLNIDRFLQVNESLGHGGGDELLRCVALRIAHDVRELDAVSRFGADEFAVVLDHATDAAAALEVCHRVHRALQEPLQVLGTELCVTASVGLALAPAHGDSAEALLRSAVGAMQVAKALGGNSVHLSTGNDEASARERVGMETALRRALERKEFELVYQPIWSVSTRRVLRVEALLRWQGAQYGSVGPERFIPILEQTGLIANVGEWVLRESLLQLKRWHDAGFSELGVAVNVSPIQLLRGDLSKLLPELLRQHGLPGSALELELTESVVMADPEHSIATLQEFRALGVTIAVDDFGTGYSSLSYLRRLPIQKLKIDKSFTKDLGNNADDTTIVKTIIAMAHVLKLQAVAEGVETQDQLAFLSEQNCDEAQGYLVSKPLRVEAMSEFLRKNHLGLVNC